MDTIFELVRATRSLKQGRPGAFREVFNLTVCDVFYQLQFVLCDKEKINDELVKFYTKLSGSAYLLDSADHIAELVNDSVLRQSLDILSHNFSDQYDKEKRHEYNVGFYSEDVLSGPQISDTEYHMTLMNYICTLPEIFRHTALAYYYDNLPMEKLVDILNVDSETIRSRITYIEKTLAHQMHSYCKKKGYSKRVFNPQKIKVAMVGLYKLYKYPYPDELFANIQAKLK